MPLPHPIARLNKRCTNRFIEPIVRRTRRFAIVHHVGRRSGHAYATPLYAFDRQGSLLIALTYGPQADWARNVAAGAATIHYQGAEYSIVSATVVDRAAAWPHLPRGVRLWLRVLRVSDFMLLDVR